MALFLFKQSVRGNSRSVELDLSAADAATISALMIGKVTSFGAYATGGTDVATPATLRSIKLGVNRKLDRLSATVNLKHVKPTKHLTDIFADKAMFDADFQSALSATGIRAVYEGSK